MISSARWARRALRALPRCGAKVHLPMRPEPTRCSVDFFKQPRHERAELFSVENSLALGGLAWCITR
jgi:hypothetical protein